MKRIFLIVSIAISVIACNSENNTKEQKAEANAVVEYDNYGMKMSPDGAVDINTLVEEMGNAPSYEAKIYGKVVEVCQTRGCWMNIEIGNGELMRVTFKDYGFFVPTDSAMIVGQQVIMQGLAQFETVSVEDLKHYAEDAGESKEYIDAITEPENSLTFEATGVLVPKTTPLTDVQANATH